jgi:hypothetical protein
LLAGRKTVDIYLKILELGLDARTWTDYIVQQTRDVMHHESSGQDLTDIAAGVERLSKKVDEMKSLLAEYITKPAPAAAGPRQFTDLFTAQEAFRADDGYPTDTLLGKYYAVGNAQEGFDIQFLTRELSQRLRADRPEWQIIELKK